jgi:hypothetical protein
MFILHPLWFEPLELVKTPTKKIARNDPSLASRSQSSHSFGGLTTFTLW